MGIPVALHGFVGGGTSLNYDVVQYEPGSEPPESAEANTIVVFTDVDITGHIFSATEPENMANGEVWFATGTSSPVAFNALKKNGIEVYPMSAKQCVDGELVDVAAQIYQDGEWNELGTIVFDKANQTFTSIYNHLHIADDEKYSLIADSGDYVAMTVGAGSIVGRGWQWKTPYDFSEYSVLEVVGYSTSGSFGIALNLKKAGEASRVVEVASAGLNSLEQVHRLDISAISTTGYIGFYADKAGDTIYVKKVSLI